ncbi:hypothetical protein BGZ63DRAFT_82107 [Mariannaea sp. PMI_226]|nr:hypothetical protein BGZ63DRAFT_82107 [Mariannaea sp. PMI_226]
MLRCMARGVGGDCDRLTDDGPCRGKGRGKVGNRDDRASFGECNGREYKICFLGSLRRPSQIPGDSRGPPAYRSRLIVSRRRRCSHALNPRWRHHSIGHAFMRVNWVMWVLRRQIDGAPTSSLIGLRHNT